MERNFQENLSLFLLNWKISEHQHRTLNPYYIGGFIIPRQLIHVALLISGQPP